MIGGLIAVILASLLIIIPYSIRERRYSAPIKDAPSVSPIPLTKLEKKFGFSESQRKKIFQEYIKAEDRASIEEANINKDNYSPEECYRTLHSLQEKYKNKITKKYSITREQLEKIAMEGINKKWPMPK